MKISFFRHGATEGNRQKTYIGATDQPLSPEGISDLIKIKSSFSPNLLKPKEIYVSEKIRTQETGKILFPQTPQIIIPDFNEMNFGIFEGKTFHQLKNNSDYRAWVLGNCEGICPQGEGKSKFIHRTKTAFLSIIKNSTFHRKELIFIVHGGTIMAICSSFVPNSDYFQWQISCGEKLEFHWNGTYLEEVK